jgi:hypothetical protein
MLQLHLLDHVPNDDDDHNHIGAHTFRMNTACEANGHCGTVGCIGGNMGLIMGKDIIGAQQYVGRCRDASDTSSDMIGIAVKSPALHTLFYPPNWVNYRTITPAQAIKAIDNWLKTGRPNWSKVLTKRNRERD